MAQQLDQKEIVTIDELAKSNMFQLEVITRILVKKGIMTREEFIEEAQELKREMAEKGTVEC
jgi:predicted flap endonuclease-1-like 5' DNA nuclease